MYLQAFIQTLLWLVLCIKIQLTTCFNKTKTKAAFSLVFFIFLTNTALAGGQFRVTPIRIEFLEGEKIALLTVKNEGDTAALIQTELLKWQQKDNEDDLSIAKDIIVSPPIFNLAAHAQQNIRLGLRFVPPQDVELAYRIKISEVPTPEMQEEKQGLNVMLSFSVPIFVRPKKFVTKYVSEWHTRIEGEKLKVSLSNLGNTHEQIKKFKIFSGSTLIVESAAMAYVLPGQVRFWQVKLPAGYKAQALRVEAESDRGLIEANLKND